MKHIITFVLLLIAFMVQGQGLPIYYIGQPLPSDTTQRYLIVSKVDTNAINNHSFDSLRVTDFITMLNTYGIADSLPGDNFADSIYKAGNKILLRDGQGFVIDNDDDDTNELGYMNWYTGPPAILPTCSSSEEGDFLVNSFDGYLQYCDGSLWQNVTTINEIDTFYINGTQLLNGDSLIIGLWIDSTSNTYRITIPGSTDTLTLQRGGSGIDSLWSEVADAWLTNLDTIPKQTISIDSSGRTFIISQTAGPNIVFEDQVNDTLTNEEVEDIAGAMFTGNTETLITSTYDDPTGKVNLAVEDDLSLYDNSTSGFVTSSGITSINGLTNSTLTITPDRANTYSNWNVFSSGADIDIQIPMELNSTGLRLGYLAENGSGTNVSIGAEAGRYATGGNCIAIGRQALKGVSGSSSGTNNIGIGIQSFYQTTTGINNFGAGSYSGASNTTGNNNFALGESALVFNQTGSDNFAAGRWALRGVVGVSVGSCVGIGTYSFRSVQGNNNVGIGALSGEFNSGANNVFIGSGSGRSSGSTTGSIYIGTNAGNTFVRNNTLLIDNQNWGANSLVYGEFDNDVLRTNGLHYFRPKTTMTNVWEYSASPTNYKLELEQTITSGNVRWGFNQVNNGTRTDDILLFDQGNVVIGGTNASAKLDVTGDTELNGELTVTDRIGGAATSITGADATNQIVDVTLGDKLELTSGTLNVKTINYAMLKMSLPSTQDLNTTTSTKINFDSAVNSGTFTASTTNDYITTSTQQPVLINVSGQVRTTGTCTTAPPTVRVRLMSGTSTQVAEIETNASGLNYEHAFSITHIDTAFTTSDQYQVQVIGPSSSCPLKYQNVSLTITGL